MKILGIIPARGGSKRVPKKNIRLLAAKPLIAYTIEVALQTRCIDRLIVSTDDDEIAHIAQKYDAEVPFIRPVELGQDSTPDQPVFRHALGWLKEQEDYVPDLVLNLRPTTPFKTPQIIEEVVRRVIETGADMVRTMSRVSGVNHPYWMYRLSEEGQVRPFVTEIKVADYYQSQLLPPVYRINGLVDAIRPRAIYEGNFLNATNMIAVVVSDEASIDADTELDLKLCEVLLNDARAI